ncbi:MAG TPA: ABC transporter substrate-binding protein [Stenomitos sp.]
MKRTPWLALTVASSLSLILAGCPAPGSNQGTSSTDTVKIGYIGTITGGDAVLGETTTNAAKLAIEQINAAGGVNGKNLELLIRDDGGEEEAGIKAAQALKEKGVVAVLGPVYSGVAKQVMEQVLREAGIPSISPSATSPQLTTFNDGGLFFRTIPSDSLQGKALSQQIQGDGHSKIAILCRDNSYGNGLADALVSDFNAHNGNMAVKVAYPDTDDQTGYDAIAARIPSDVTAITLAGYLTDGIQIFKAWHTAGGNTAAIKWYFSESYYDESFANNVNATSALEGLKGTNPYSESPYLADFKAAYKDRFKLDAAYFAENAYDATMLLALAMVKGGANTPAAIKDNLVSVAAGGTKQTGIGSAGFADAVAKLKAGTDLDYDGASGTCDMDANGELTRGSYMIWSWQNGKPVPSGNIVRF